MIPDSEGRPTKADPMQFQMDERWMWLMVGRCMRLRNASVRGEYSLFQGTDKPKSSPVTVSELRQENLWRKFKRI